MRSSVGIESRFEKEARRGNDSKNAENQGGRGGFGHVCNVAQVISSLSKGLDDDLSQAFEVAKGQFDLSLLSPCASRRDGGIRHVWQSLDGRPGKIKPSGRNPSHSNDKQCQRQPFSSGEEIELAQCKIRKQDYQQRYTKMQKPRQNDRCGEHCIRNSRGGNHDSLTPLTPSLPDIVN